MTLEASKDMAAERRIREHSTVWVIKKYPFRVFF